MKYKLSPADYQPGLERSRTESISSSIESPSWHAKDRSDYNNNTSSFDQNCHILVSLVSVISSRVVLKVCNRLSNNGNDL